MFPCALMLAISPAVDVVFPAAALDVVTSGVVVVLHGKSTHRIVSFFAGLLFGSLVPSLATYSNRSISLLTKTPECSMAIVESHSHSFAELSLILDT